MATTVDLNAMLENLQTALEAANTTTASPIDLSSSLSTSSGRVKQIYKVHPNRIRPEGNLMPFVTCYIKGKQMQDQTFAKSQLNIKRKAVVNLDVVGAIWNTSFASADEDPADKDIHILMENIELALRGSENLTASVQWQMADGVEYYDTALDEQTNLRCGILSLKATVYY